MRRTLKSCPDVGEHTRNVVSSSTRYLSFIICTVAMSALFGLHSKGNNSVKLCLPIWAMNVQDHYFLYSLMLDAEILLSLP